MNRRSWVLLSAAVIAAFSLAALLWFRTQDKGPGGKSVHLRLESFALNLHPLKMADVESRRVATLLYVGLVAVDQDGAVTGALAAGWNHTGDEWQFALRPGVTFSNGAPVGARDVEASLCAAMQPASPWAWALASIAHEADPDGSTKCTGIRILSDGRLAIREASPVPWFLDAISGPAGWVLPASNADGGDYGAMPGAGPYRVAEIVPDVKVVLEARKEGSPVPPGAAAVQFDYLPDDTVAARRFAAGGLQVIALTSPLLVELLAEDDGARLKTPGKLTRVPWDRVRIVIINERALAEKGFAPGQIRSFIDAFDASVDRSRIAGLSRGIGTPIEIAFFPQPADLPVRSMPRDVSGLPATRLTIVTEPDPYSDLIAASLPHSVGPVSFDYKGMEKGILIDSLVKGKFDIASIVIEATVHSPEFWRSFFTPGNAYTVFGMPIPGLSGLSVATPEGASKAARIIAREGNWVAIMREHRIQATAPAISGIAFSPSGQANYARIQSE